jgi:hypothetical protein
MAEFNLKDTKKKLGLEGYSDEGVLFAFREKFPELKEIDDNELGRSLEMKYMGRGERFRRGLKRGVVNIGEVIDRSERKTYEKLQSRHPERPEYGDLDVSKTQIRSHLPSEEQIAVPPAADWKDTLIDMASQEMVEVPAELAIESMLGLPPGFSKMNKARKVLTRMGKNALVGAGVAQMRPYETAGERAIGTAVSAGAYGAFALPKVGGAAVGGMVGAAIDRDNPGRGAAIGAGAGLGVPMALKRLMPDKIGRPEAGGGNLEVEQMPVLDDGLIPESHRLPAVNATNKPRQLAESTVGDEVVVPADPNQPEIPRLLYEEASRYGIPLRYGADPTSGGWKSIDYLRQEVAQAKIQRGKGRRGRTDPSKVESVDAEVTPRRMRLPEHDGPAGYLPEQPAHYLPEPEQAGRTSGAVENLMPRKRGVPDRAKMYDQWGYDLQSPGGYEGLTRQLSHEQGRAGMQHLADTEADLPFRPLNELGRKVSSGEYGKDIPKGPAPKNRNDLAPKARQARQEPTSLQKEAQQRGIPIFKDNGDPYSDQYLRLRIGSKKKIDSTTPTLAQFVRKQGGIKTSADYNTKELKQDIGVNIIRKNGIAADDLAKIAREEHGYDVRDGDHLIESLKDERFKLKHGGGKVGDQFSRHEAELEQAGAAEEGRFKEDVQKARAHFGDVTPESMPESKVADKLNNGDVVRLPGDDDVYKVIEESSETDFGVRVKDGTEKVLDNWDQVEKIGEAKKVESRKSKVERQKIEQRTMELDEGQTADSSPQSAKATAKATAKDESVSGKEAWLMTQGEFVKTNAASFPGQEAQVKAMHKKAVLRAMNEQKEVPKNVLESAGIYEVEKKPAFTVNTGDFEYQVELEKGIAGWQSRVYKRPLRGAKEEQVLHPLKENERVPKAVSNRIKKELGEEVPAGQDDLFSGESATQTQGRRTVDAETPVERQTRVEKTGAGDQIVDMELRPQAEMPKGKIGDKSEAIEGRGGVGMFAEPEPVVDQGDLFAQPKKELPAKVQRVIDRKKSKVEEKPAQGGASSNYRLNTSGLGSMQQGRLNKALNKQYRLADEGVGSIKDFLDKGVFGSKRITKPMFNRRHYNRLDYEGQAKYEANLEKRKVYEFTFAGKNRSIDVPKIVYDAVDFDGTPGQKALPEKVQRIIDKKKARVESKKPATTTKVIPKTGSLAEQHGGFMDRLKRGNVTVAEVQANFKSIQDNEAAIKAELGGKTKKELLNMMGGMQKYRYKNEKKDRVIEAVFDDMLSDHNLSGSLSFGFEKGGYQRALQAKVNKVTDADIKDFAEMVKKNTAEAKEASKKLIKALENPETLDEFREFIHYRGKGKLNADQVERLDGLVADDMRDINKMRAADRAKLGQVKTDTEMKIIAGKHTKKGTDIWTVTLADRVERDVYKDLLSKAKSLGGYYSRYRGGGAHPGFIFESEAAAKKFTSLKEGAVDASSEVAEKVVKKQAKAGDKLREMADKLEESGNASLNQERQANTARRARMAASAEADAQHNIAFAKTMRNVAEAIDSGKAKHLEQLSQKVQLEELQQISSDAKWKAHQEENIRWDKSKEMSLKREDLRHAKMPEFYSDPEHLIRVANDLSNVQGGKMLAQRLRTAARKIKAAGQKKLGITAELAEKVVKKLGKDKVWQWDRTIEKNSRLKRMGIENDSQLRAALRELFDSRVEAKGEDSIAKLERALVGRKIEGYFPTPKKTVDRMLEEAAIEPGMKVLEPSAGKGNIADIIKAEHPDAGIETIEMVGDLRNVLEAKGHKIVGYNALEHTGEYDRIVMNPPFEKGADMDHVRHAFDTNLKPGGKLVSIMSEGPFFRNDKKAKEFREWLDEVGGWSEKLPDGAFKSSERPTGVSTRMVVIDKANVGPRKSGTLSIKANPVGLAFGIEKEEDGTYTYNPAKGLAGFASMSVLPTMLKQTRMDWMNRSKSGVASGQDVVDAFSRSFRGAKEGAKDRVLKLRDWSKGINDWFDGVAKTDFDRSNLRRAGGIISNVEGIKTDADLLTKKFRAKVMAEMIRNKVPDAIKKDNVDFETNVRTSAASMIMEYGAGLGDPKFWDDLAEVRRLWKANDMPKSAHRMLERTVAMAQKPDQNTLWLAAQLQRSYKELFAVAHDEGMIQNFRENYITHLWGMKDVSGNKISDLAIKKAFKFAKPRAINDYMEGMKFGFLPMTMNSIELNKIYRQELVRTIANRRFVKELGSLHIETPDGELPMMIKENVLEDLNIGQQRLYEPINSPAFKEYYKSDDGKWHAKNLYVHNDVAKGIKSIFGTSKMKEMPVTRGLLKMNNLYKRMKLAASGFHHVALGYNNLFLGKDVKGLNNPMPFDIGPWKSVYKTGMAAIESKDAILKHGLKNGLTLRETGAGADYANTAKDVITKFVDTSDPGIGRMVADLGRKGVHLWDDALWNKYYAGSKAQIFKLQYARQLKALANNPKYKKQHADWEWMGSPIEGKTEFESIAAQIAARNTNDLYGGLNRELLKISDTTWDAMRLGLLAPDWTLSNWRYTINGLRELASVKGKSAAGSVAAQDMLKTTLMLGALGYGLNKAFTGHSQLENPKGTKNMVAIGEMGGDKMLYLDLYRHFGEPLKVFKSGKSGKPGTWFYDSPVRYAVNKSSAILRIIDMIRTGEDWRGRPLATWDDLMNGKFHGDPYKPYWERGSSLPGVALIAFGESAIPIPITTGMRVAGGDEAPAVGIGSVFGVHLKEEPRSYPSKKNNSVYVKPKRAKNSRSGRKGRSGRPVKKRGR